MMNQYLTEEQEFPEDLDWDAHIEVIPHRPENPQAQVRLQNLPWESALYQGGKDFQYVPERLSCVYHHLMDGYLPVDYEFSNCRIDQEGWIEIRGELRTENRERRGNNSARKSRVIASATLKVRLKDSRTHGAVREYLESQQNRGDEAPG